MKKQITKNQNGFTLVETIVYVAIFSLFVVGMVSFVNNLISVRVNSQTAFEINDQGTQAINVMTQKIRNAVAVNSPTIGATAASLSITTDSFATSPTVFSLSSGILYITEGAGSPVALTNSKITITNLIFSNLMRTGKPATIQIRFVANSTNFYGSASLRK